MKRTTRPGALAASVIVALALAPAVPAKTVVPSSGSLFADHEARNVDDVITVLIVESAEATKTARTETSSSTSNDASSFGRLDFVDFWNLDVNNATRGEGVTRRRGDLQARITCRVTDVEPSGLLLLEGTRSVRVNGEEEAIVLKGAVRPQDVRSDNTVLSTFLADAVIEYTGEGVLASAARPGILSRILNWIF